MGFFFFNFKNLILYSIFFYNRPECYVESARLTLDDGDCAGAWEILQPALQISLPPASNPHYYYHHCLLPLTAAQVHPNAIFCFAKPRVGHVDKFKNGPKNEIHVFGYL